MKKTVKRAVSVAVTIAMLLLTLIPMASTALAESPTQWKTYKELIKEKGFVNGIQQPWTIDGSIGQDIGAGVLNKYGATKFSEETYEKLFTNCKAMGFDICKLWITYQRGGIVFDADGHVVGVETKYLANLPKVFEIAQKHGMYLCIALLDHEEGFSPDFRSSKYQYDLYSRFINDPAETKLFIDNFLTPVINITKDYDNVVLCDLFVEPEAEGGRWSISRGTNWDNMRRFLSDINKAVKAANPRLATTASSGSDYAQGLAKGVYDDLGLDYYAYDYYSNSGEVLNVSEMFLDRPLIYGEVGTDGSNKTNEYMSSFVSNYLSTALDGGVKGGFFWKYGFNTGAVDSVLRTDGLLRGYTVAFRYFSLDRDYAKAGYTGIDTPTFIYSTNDEIMWYGSRGATNISLQRSEDNTSWSDIISFNPDTDTQYEFEAMMYHYTDITAGQKKTYYYRVVATDENGAQKVSETIDIFFPITTCTDAENIVVNPSFEDESKYNIPVSDGGKGGWAKIDYPSSMGWGPDMVQYIKDGTAGDTTHSGTHSLFKVGIIYQIVPLKKNTNYTFTYYYKYTNKNGGGYAALATDYPDMTVANNKWLLIDNCTYNQTIGKVTIGNENKTGEWRYYTASFNSGDLDEVMIFFYEWQGYKTPTDPLSGQINAQWYLDDVYLFESDT